MQDFYQSLKVKGKMLSKWRKAEIRAVGDGTITVHYIGWSEEWNETIDTAVDSHRIASAGSMTEVVELPTQEDTSPSRTSNTHSGRYSDATTAVAGPNARYGQATMKTKRRSFDDRTMSSYNHEDEAITTIEERETQRPKPQRRGSVDSNINSTKAHNKTMDPRGHEQLRSQSSTNHHRSQTLRSAPQLNGYHHDNVSHLDHNFQTDDDYLENGDVMNEEEIQAMLRQEQQFEAKLKQKGMHIHQIAGDGNCLFRAVSHQIYGKDSKHLDLRKQCVNHMRQYKDRFKLFCETDFNTYLNHMQLSRTWGTEMEIRALEEITDKLICIYASDSKKIEPLKTHFDDMSLFDGSVEQSAPILLSFHGHNHYNSIYNERNPLPLGMSTTKRILTIREQRKASEGE